MVSWLEWGKTQEKQLIQAQLFLSLTAEEQLFYDALETPCTIDKLAFKFKTPISQLAAILLKMEFKGAIRALGGNRFEQI